MRPDPRPRRSRDLIPERGRRLRSGGFQPIHRGLWVPREVDRADPLVRIEALTVLYPGAVATGWLAAAAHGHPFPPNAIVDEFAGTGVRCRRPGVMARQYSIPSEHVVERTSRSGRTLHLASPAWSLFDISRHGTLTEAVCALDFSPDLSVNPHRDLPLLASEVGPLPGKRQMLRALDLCDTRAESPWETRTRLFLLEHGITGFEAQVTIPELGYRLDLARGDLKIAVEYDGAHHRDGEQHTRDLTRWNRLRRAGWLVYPVTARMILRDPHATAEDILAGIRSRE